MQIDASFCIDSSSVSVISPTIKSIRMTETAYKIKES